MQILLDVDGVLADFGKAIGDAHGYDSDELFSRPESKGVWDTPDLLGMTPAEWWAPCDRAEFWAGIPLTAEAEALVELCEQMVGPENVCLLTSPSRSPASVVGKIQWVREHFPQFERRMLIGPAKQFCAGFDHILIDDNDDNVATFEEHGGLAILVPRPWNMNHRCLIEPLSYIGLWLEEYVKSPAFYSYEKVAQFLEDYDYRYYLDGEAAGCRPRQDEGR